MRKNAILNSPRLLELRRKKYRSTKKKIIIFFIFIFIFILGLSFVFRIPALNIDKVIISGNKVIETEDILKVVQNEIYDDYFFLFPKTNFLIYPKNKLEKQLRENFKRIKNISINNKDIKNLEILIDEYKGEYLWCGYLIPPLNSNLEDNKCYFMDENGYIFDEAPYFSGQVYFKFYGFLNNEKIIGSNYFSKNFKDLISFKENLENMNLNPTNFWINWYKTGEEGNFSLSGEPLFSPSIIFNIDTNYQKLIENLQTAISTEPLKSNLKKKSASLLYLDLRFGNKVYYKFK